MKRSIIFKISLVICFGFYSLMATAQQVNTLYFMENVPIRHNFNPAFQTYSNFYLGLPVLGYTQMGFGNNSITLKDLIYKQNGQSIFFLNEHGDKDKFYNALNPTTLLQTNLQINLLDFGFRKGKSYWTFGLTEKIDGELGIPKDLMKLLLYGTPQIDNNIYNLQSLSTDFTAYTEAALGYSRQLGKQFTVGAKLKLLYGNFNVSLLNTNLDMTAGINQWTLKGNSVMNYSSPIGLQIGSTFQTLNANMPTVITDWIKPSGLGGGIDLGFTYKPIKQLTLSAAVVDFGMINWTKNVVNLTNTVDYTFTGLGSLNSDTNLNFQILADSVLNALAISSTSGQTNNSYTTYTSPKLNVGAEFSFFEDRLSVGLLSRTIKRNKSYFEELTASVNGRPIDWFNLSVSYSVLNGRMSNIGAGLGLRTGFVNWSFSADYIPLSYATMPVSVGGTWLLDAPIAYNSKGFNFAVGVNLVFGNRKDEDRDGVVDRKDICPETPFSVIVDRKGCPVDTDGDGVPDYLDKCAKTPPEAYNRIDQNGCPVDNDEDGVPDYKDKCPDTPKDAISYVDSIGCLKDKDKDGVYDYIDKCPDTPLGMKVDTLGCPLDSDGDGILDAVDKCSGTPAEALGFVDKDGCPKDTDGDGVFDYLDKCANTPIEARGFVDKKGCPLDTDGDGVPDYLDKCPNTTKEERGSVDKNGCATAKELTTAKEVVTAKDKDSDGDGVPDSIDNCPNTPGPASNKGCPEIKKEAKNLFQKALQGIQFETASYVIMPVSYKILNQIAGVLIANPTYIVEIRGHTDNAGKPQTNLTLSLNRSKAVMKYLIKKGVDPGRMTANGYGDTLPVSTNKTAAGKAQNRRVEFVVTFEEITFE